MAAALLLAVVFGTSCSKELARETCEVSFVVSSAEETKAGMISDVSGIKDEEVRVLGYETDEGGTFYNKILDDKLVRSGSYWKPTERFAAKDGLTVAFGAVYPSTITLASTDPAEGAFYRIPFTVQQATANQVDFMICPPQLETISSETPVKLKMKHALAAVDFVYGRFDSEITSVKSIELYGAFTSGECNINTLFWPEDALGIGTDPLTGTTDVPIEYGKNLGSKATFLLIPQNLGVDSVSIRVTFGRSGGKEDLSTTAVLNSGSWTRATKTTYMIYYDKGLKLETIGINNMESQLVN